MKNVKIEPGCTTCGLCEFVAPEVFEVTDISRVKKDVNVTKNAEEIKEAAQGCPVSVIKYEDPSIQRAKLATQGDRAKE